MTRRCHRCNSPASPSDATFCWYCQGSVAPKPRSPEYPYIVTMCLPGRAARHARVMASSGDAALRRIRNTYQRRGLFPEVATMRRADNPADA